MTIDYFSFPTELQIQRQLSPNFKSRDSCAPAEGSISPFVYFALIDGKMWRDFYCPPQEFE
jgi:hypothetical protein